MQNLRKHPRRFAPLVDRLEGRQLLATFAVYDFGAQGKVLVVEGSPAADHIIITPQAVHVGSESLAIEPDFVGILVNAGAGDDLIRNQQEEVPVILRGEEGDDRIHTVAVNSPAFLNVVYGGPGANTLTGDPTRSALYAEAVNFLTVDALGPLAVFADDSDAANQITVSTDGEGNTLVEDEFGGTFLPPTFLAAFFDLGAGDDLFTDSSESFLTIVDGGPGDDTIVADIVYSN